MSKEDEIEKLIEDLNKFDFGENGASTIATKVLGELGEIQPLSDILSQMNWRNQWHVPEVIIESLQAIGGTKGMTALLVGLEEECEHLLEFDVGNSKRSPSYDMEGYFSCGRLLDGILHLYSTTRDEIVIESLVGLLNRDGKCGDWWTFEIAFSGLRELGWTPQTDEERINVSIAKAIISGGSNWTIGDNNWENCIEMGEETAKKAVKYLTCMIYFYDQEEYHHPSGTWRVGEDLIQAIKMFGKVGLIGLTQDCKASYPCDCCGHCSSDEKEKILKFLGSDDPEEVWKGVSLLKGMVDI